ncbi:MAG: nitrogenase molybdenum-iron protein [Clostridia bacterium]|nr:nitrogenase molybdenum-iron protein [Clostridia bacterium]
MKGLYRYLSPFASDQSGASSVLYGLGGMIVILDAGGCAGNVCGFDEPRWFTEPAAIYSAGMRDLDAILGRDERTIEKIEQAAKTVDASFIALIGTPVPAVVGTDLRAMGRMVETRCGIPAFALDTTGMQDYDVGQEKAYLLLLGLLKTGKIPTVDGTGEIGILGATPLDLLSDDSAEVLRSRIEAREGAKATCFGMQDGLHGIGKMTSVRKNYVVSASGLKPARYLQKTFGIPYEIGFFFDPLSKDSPFAAATGKTLLLSHQILGNSLRESMEAGNVPAEHIDVATYFKQEPALARPNDFQLHSEYELLSLLDRYDTILCDSVYQRAMKQYRGQRITLPHFAVSGEIGQSTHEKELLP